MEDLELNQQLMKEDLFTLFKTQLQKDFEVSGIPTDFIKELPSNFGLLRTELIVQLKPVLKNTYSSLSNLLYRVDISESQVKKYEQTNPELNFEEQIAELIIKRILQKVILKKRFSN